MIQLSYQPAFDPAHAIFRFLRIQRALSLSTIEFDKLRLLDYYLLFPFRAASIKLIQKDLRVRSAAKKLEDRAGYAALPSGVVLFERMKNTQVAASQTLAKNGFLDPRRLHHGTMQFGELSLPTAYEARLMQANEQDPQTMMILGVLAGYNLFGSGGLKDRTGLIEYQYDNV